MKSLIKLTLVVCLFAPVVLADGEMGNGNRGCTPTATCFATVAVDEKGDKIPADNENGGTMLQDLRDFFGDVLEFIGA